MLEYLRGTLEERGPNWVVLDLQGIGFHIQTPASTVETLPAVGETVRLYAYLHVREDVRAIYGFATREERTLFTTLLGVTGVGPRMALAALSILPPTRLAQAVESDDVATLSKVPGIGRKTASQIVLSLKGKLPATALPTGGGAAAPTSLVSDIQEYLGITPAQAADLLASLPPDPARDDAETWRLALQAYGARRSR